MSGQVHGLLAGTLGALAVVVFALPRRPPPRPALPASPVRPNHLGPVHQLTISLCRALRIPVPPDRTRRQLPAVAAAVAVTALVAPPLALLVVGGAWLRSRQRSVRARRTTERAIADALPDAVDLLLLTISAGRSLPIAHPLVAQRVPPPLGQALGIAAVEALGGRTRADALVDALTPLGDRALALGHVLADHLRYGVPLAPTLERLGAELRTERRRRAEQDARRVPVRLLAPLVACVLPAFGLLTIVPLLAASLRALPT